MSFVQSIQNTATTLNGAVSHKSSLNANLDLFSMGISDLSDTLIRKAWNEDPLICTKVVFYLRDCRGGQGNRDILHVFSRLLFGELDNTDLLPLLSFYPTIGYWKDLFKLYGTSQGVDESICYLTREALNAGDRLCAKWAPRQGPLAKALAAYMQLDHGDYRRLIVRLSDTVEQRMCSGQWSAINYKAVPSRANHRYSEAFIRHDAARRYPFLEQVQAGQTSMKSGQLYPHEIVHLVDSQSTTADAMWESYPKLEHIRRILPVIDVSGSMESNLYSSKGTCMDAAIGLGMYFAEQNTGAYHNLVCTFHHSPTFETLPDAPFSQQVRFVRNLPWGGSTDIQAVFDRILTYGHYDDAPEMILIVSDMEFNSACSAYRTNFQAIDAKFKAAGLKRPTIVFWRVDVKVAQQPVTKNTNGTILINGYSPAIMQAVLKCDFDNITPEAFMHQAIAKYDYVDPLF